MNKLILAVITALIAAVLTACGAAPAPAAPSAKVATQVAVPKTTAQPTQVVASFEVASFEFEGQKFSPADLKSLAREKVRRERAREELMERLKSQGCFSYSCVLIQPGFGFDKWASVKVNGSSSEFLVRGDAIITYNDGGYNQGPVDESIRTIQVKASTLKEKDTSMYLKLVVLNSYGDPLFIEGPVDEVVEASLHL